MQGIRLRWQTQPFRVGTAAITAFVVLGIAAVALELTLAPSKGQQAVCLALMAVAAGSAAIMTMRRQPAARNPWLLCWLLLQMGGFASAFAMRTAGPSASHPSLADALWIGAGIALIAALVDRIRADVPVRDPTAVLDATVIATSVGAILWATVMAPSVSAGPTSVLARSVAVAYPVLDIATLGLLGYLWIVTRQREDLPLLVSGVALLLVSDLLFALRSTLGFASKDELVRPSALLALLLLAAVLVRRPPGDGIPTPPRVRPRAHVWIMVIAALAPLVLASITAFDDWVFPASELSTMLIVSTALIIAMSCRLIALLGTSGRIATTIQQHRFEALAHASTDVIAIIDHDRRFRYVSPTAPESWLVAPQELVGISVDALAAPQDRARLTEHFDRLPTSNGAPVTFEVKLDPMIAADARAEIILVDLLEDPAVDGIGLTVRDVTERVNFERRLHTQAFHDGLTGLANRALFADRLDQALTCVRNSPERLSALLFIDLDDFKRVNDSLGHSAGDALLIEISERIRRCIRIDDTAARIGGDEFAVLLEGLDHEAEVIEIATRILECLERPVSVHGSVVAVAGSIGVRMFDASTTPTVAMRDADLAMYRAKHNGKGRYELYAPELHAAALANFELRSELEQAVRSNQLVLHYQTIHELGSNRVVGAEALLRWQHPERGLILPDDFIGVAEQSGLLVPIGGWAMTQACSDLQRLDAVAHRPLWVSVNVSPVQFSAVKLTTVVRNALARSRIQASRLRVEITESVLLDDSEENVRVLEELRAMGCRIAIDDFGTGYSSLSYLQRYPIDVVKIDRSFVTDASADPARLAITESIVRLAGALDLACVAEGIESTHDRQLLNSLGCRYGQGFLFSRPMPLDELVLLLAADVEQNDSEETSRPAGSRPLERPSTASR